MRKGRKEKVRPPEDKAQAEVVPSPLAGSFSPHWPRYCWRARLHLQCSVDRAEQSRGACLVAQADAYVTGLAEGAAAGDEDASN